MPRPVAERSGAAAGESGIQPEACQVGANEMDFNLARVDREIANSPAGAGAANNNKRAQIGAT
jgi:hypothetical protein